MQFSRSLLGSKRAIMMRTVLKEFAVVPSYVEFPCLEIIFFPQIFKMRGGGMGLHWDGITL